VVLITGIIYVITGGLFALSPHLFGNIFSVDINEDWFNEIPKDPFMFMTLTLSRSLAFLLFTIGLSMVLPLFDPLKYRGLVYYTGIIFPFVATLIFVINTITNSVGILMLYSAVFFIIFISTSVALWLTRESVKSGIE